MNGKTLGERRVRVDFNVTKNADVDEVKVGTASLINLCEKAKIDVKSIIPPETNQRDVAIAADFVSTRLEVDEANRCFSTAQTYYEIAAMFAVKGFTAAIKQKKV